jgi:hypothetical protein
MAHDVRAADQHLAALAGRNVAAGIVDDPQVAVQRGLAGRAGRAPGILAPLVGRDRRGLGGA